MSNNLSLTRVSSSYREVVQATESVESPGLGFAKPSEYQGAFSGNSAIIKQNNTQIQLLVQISESLKEIQSDLKTLLNKSAKVNDDTTPLLEDLITKLNNLSLEPKEKVKEAKGRIRVFKDPYTILREE